MEVVPEAFIQNEANKVMHDNTVDCCVMPNKTCEIKHSEEPPGQILLQIKYTY